MLETQRGFDPTEMPQRALPEQASEPEVKSVEPPAELERVVEKKSDLLRKLEIQVQVMNHLGYGLREGEDPQTLAENEATMDLWRLGRLAEAFDFYWRGPWVQQKLAEGAPDDEIAEALDVELNSIVPSAEVKNLQSVLWPEVEKQLKDDLQIDDKDVKIFTPMQHRWEELFNAYLKLLLKDPKRKGYSPRRLANLIADTIGEDTRNNFEDHPWSTDIFRKLGLSKD